MRRIGRTADSKGGMRGKMVGDDGLEPPTLSV